MPPKHEPFLWVYDIATKIWRKRAPKNVALENDYYEIEDVTGQPTDFLERFLSKMEGWTARLLRGPVRAKADLSEDDRTTLATFVALMMLRTPAEHTMIGKFMADVLEMTLTMGRNHWEKNPEALEEFKRHYKRHTGKDDLDNLTVEAMDTRKYDIQVKNDTVVALSMSQVLEISQIIEQMNWTFLHSGGHDFFVASDHPFHMFNQVAARTKGGVGLAMKSTEVTLPLARNVGLVAVWKEGLPSVLDCTTEQVAHFNARTCSRPAKEIYSPNKIFPGAEKILPLLH